MRAVDTDDIVTGEFLAVLEIERDLVIGCVFDFLEGMFPLHV